MSEAKTATAAVTRRLAENLVLLRDCAGLSQEHAAERAGLHRTQLSSLERGLQLPRLDTIVRLGGALEVKPCELLVGMAWRLGSDVRRDGGYVERNQAMPSSTRKRPDG